MKMAAGAVTPVMAAKVAGALGLPEGVVRKAMAVGVPVILASLLKRGSTAGGTEAIAATLGGLGKNPLDGMSGAVGDASQVSAAAQSGSDMLASLMGTGTSTSLAKTLAGYAGIDEKAAGPMLGLAGSAALGGLKTAAGEQGLDAAGVMRLLGSQKEQINAAIPSDLGRMLSVAGILPQAEDTRSTVRAATPVKPAAPAQAAAS
jgi:OmpA-OmpF porin, OOP family